MTLAAPVPRSRGCLGAGRTGQSPPSLQAAPLPLSFPLVGPCLDLVPAWQPVGLEKPSHSAEGPSSGVVP